MEFTGKIALITGGGGGIGRASALGFARRGAKVGVVDLDPTEGEESAELARPQGRGAVVNTASVAGLFGGPGMAPYVASKHGVLGLTKVASADVARLGIRVNAVCPGPVETRMMRSLEAQRNPADPQAVHDANRRKYAH